MLDELQERIAAFDGALNERGMRQDELVPARARIEASLTRALQAVETLDVAVANHLGNDPVVLPCGSAIDAGLMARGLRRRRETARPPSRSLCLCLVRRRDQEDRDGGAGRVSGPIATCNVA